MVDKEDSGLREGAGVHVWLVGGTPDHPGGLESYCDRALLALESYGQGLTVKQLAANTAYMSLRDAWYIGRAFMTLARARRRIDLVWVQVSNLPDLMYLLAAKLLGLPTLVTPHFGANSRMQKVAWRRFVCRSLLGLADRIGLLFDDQDREISLPNGAVLSTVSTFLPRLALVDPPAGASVEKRRLRIVHAGRFSADKGSFQMLEVCACLRERGIAFNAQLIGRSDEATMQRMREMIAASDLESEVELVDWLSEADMQQALRDADVLVHLSAIDSFPLIVLEALASGTLPIIRNMAGAKHMVTKLGGHVVEHGRAVADACEWICNLDKESLREQQAQARIRTRATYGWQTVVAALSATFEQTLKRSV